MLGNIFLPRVGLMPPITLDRETKRNQPSWSLALAYL